MFIGSNYSRVLVNSKIQFNKIDLLIERNKILKILKHTTSISIC